MPDITGMENQPDPKTLEKTRDAVDRHEFTGRRCMGISNYANRNRGRDIEPFRHDWELSRPRSAAPHASSVQVAFATNSRYQARAREHAMVAMRLEEERAPDSPLAMRT